MTEKLRALLRRSQPSLVLGAHDALSAKLAEEAGFDAIWASGFGISAVSALPDANILTMSEDARRGPTHERGGQHPRYCRL